MRKWLFVCLFLFVGFFGVRQIGLAQGSVVEPAWMGKVDTAVSRAAAQGETDFIVLLTEQADLSGAEGLATQAEKGRYVVERLTAVANRSQKPILQQLELMDVAHQSFWINNMISVRGDIGVVRTLAQRPEVAQISANLPAKQDVPVEQPVGKAPQAVEAIEWGVTKINADDVWALGYTGQGVVVAGQDTGYQWDHPALQNQYRGWDGAAADHNYNWHDAIHMIDSHNGGTNPCGINLAAPCDDNSHGTHTMGTMVGDDGGSNQIGVAPGAEWISCRDMERGWGTPTTYAECFQWFMAPTDLNGLNPDPAKAPQVVGNSWSCPTSEGCTDPLILEGVVNNTRAAGIMIVQAASNSGSSCSSITTPAAIYDAVFSVGSTNSSDIIAGSSARGPITVDGSGRFKPDISAPGVSVRSAVPTNGYGSKSGTSMAAPHTVGLVALLLSADPGLSGQVSKIEQIIRNTAVPRTTAQTCGDIPGSEVPNHTYGYGRIDALAAVNYALTPPAAVAPTLDIEIDGSGTEELLSWNHDNANCEYELHRNSSPYFTPGPGTLLVTFWADTTTHLDDSVMNGLGNPGVNHYYKLQALDCGVGGTAVSNHVAEFDFAITVP